MTKNTDPTAEEVAKAVEVMRRHQFAQAKAAWNANAPIRDLIQSRGFTELAAQVRNTPNNMAGPIGTHLRTLALAIDGLEKSVNLTEPVMAEAPASVEGGTVSVG